LSVKATPSCHLEEGDASIFAMPRTPGSARRTQGTLGGRSEQVVRRVLDAAIVELARSGYAGFRMDEVASMAGVNKTTIYRRWPSRAALVTALVDRMRKPLRESPLPDTGQLERDLVEAFTRRFTVGRKIEGRAWARLLDERYNPEVEAIIGDAVDERRGEWMSMVTRAAPLACRPRDRRRPPAGYDLAAPRGADGHCRRSCWNARAGAQKLTEVACSIRQADETAVVDVF
jgi:AcrR family transcriptional regulator